MRWLGVTALLLLVSCLDAGTTTCADGYICPAGRVCAPAPARGCLFPDQLTVCADAEEGASCVVEGQDGICRDGLCVLHKCGDGIVSGAEICDPLVPLSADVDECTEHSFYSGGAVGCTPECRYDYSQCSGECGDGEINGNEFCEGGVVPDGYTCLDFGYDRGLITCSGRCTPGLEACSNMGWRLDRPGGTSLFTDIWMAPDGQVFAVGVFGWYLHWDGTQWKTTAPGNPEDLKTLWGTSSSNVFAAGNGPVYRFDGTTWTAEDSPGVPQEGEAIWGVSDSDLYVATKTALHHFDGSTWQPVSIGTTAGSIGAVWGSGDGQLWLTAGSRLGHRTASGVWSWIDLMGDGGTWNTLWGRSAGEVYAGNQRGVIARWNGQRWHTMDSPTKSSIESIWGTSSGVFAAAGTTILFMDASGGWSVMPTPTGEPFVGVSGTGPTNVIAVSRSGSVIRYDGSDTWILVADTDQIPTAVHATSTRNVHIGGVRSFIGRYDGVGLTERNHVLFTTNAFASNDAGLFSCSDEGVAVTTDGVSWTADNSAPDMFYANLWSAPGSSLWAVGGDAAARRLANGTWEQISPGEVGANAVDIWGRGDDDITVVGFDGVIRHYDGTEWVDQFLAPSVRFRATHGAGSLAVAVGDGGTIYHRSGDTWTLAESNTTATLSSVWVNSPEDAVAGGSAGAIRMWDGQAWQPVKLPTVGTVTDIAGPPGAIHMVTSEGELFRLLRTTQQSCATSETSCDDYWDDDCDGMLDCADPDCAAASHCSTTETSCADDLDNDGDGAIDCHDPECDGVLAEVCDDGRDNDCDGITDCADPDCGANPACGSSATCEPAQIITCGATVLGSNVAGPTDVSDFPCGTFTTSGPEAYYKFTAFETGSVTVTASGLSADLDLFVIGSSGVGCDLGSCIGYSATTVGDESVTFTGESGNIYYIVLDGFSGATSTFTLDVTCAN